MTGALKSCIQISTAATDPAGFATRLERLTGGTKLIERKIMRNLATMISEQGGKPLDPMNADQQDFGGFIESCRYAMMR